VTGRQIRKYFSVRIFHYVSVIVRPKFVMSPRVERAAAMRHKAARKKFILPKKRS